MVGEQGQVPFCAELKYPSFFTNTEEVVFLTVSGGRMGTILISEGLDTARRV